MNMLTPSKKRLFLYSLMVCFNVSCTTKQDNRKEEEKSHPTEVFISPLLSNMPQVVDKPVEPKVNTMDKEEYINFERDYDELKINISHTIGVVSVKKYLEIADRDKIEFLNIEDGTTWLSFELPCRDEECGHLYELSESMLMPRFFYPLYDMLVMDCIKEESDSYLVLVDHYPRTVKRVKKNSLLKFQTWEEHLIGEDNRLDTILSFYKNSEVRESPDGDLIVEPDWENAVAYKGIETAGEWLSIANYEDRPEERKIIGWVKWRDGDTLLVDISYLW